MRLFFILTILLFSLCSLRGQDPKSNDKEQIAVKSDASGGKKLKIMALFISQWTKGKPGKMQVMEFHKM